MIRSTKCPKNQEGTPQGTCTMKDLYFNIACITWNPHSLLDNFEHKQMLSNKKIEVTNEDLIKKERMGVTWKFILGD